MLHPSLTCSSFPAPHRHSIFGAVWCGSVWNTEYLEQSPAVVPFVGIDEFCLFMGALCALMLLMKHLDLPVCHNCQTVRWILLADCLRASVPLNVGRCLYACIWLWQWLIDHLVSQSVVWVCWRLWVITTLSSCLERQYGPPIYNLPFFICFTPYTHAHTHAHTHTHRPGNALRKVFSYTPVLVGHAKPSTGHKRPLNYSFSQPEKALQML